MEHKYIFVPRDELTTAKDSGLYKVYKDRWWLIKDTKLVFWDALTYPQCNSDKFILLHWLKNKDQDLGFSLEQIPMVYVPVNPRDLI